MVTVAIASMLASIAVPNLDSFVKDNQTTSAVNGLAGEAIKTIVFPPQANPGLQRHSLAKAP